MLDTQQNGSEAVKPVLKPVLGNESYNLHDVGKVEMSVRGVVIESADAHWYMVSNNISQCPR